MQDCVNGAYFIVREDCPVCASAHCETFYSVPFTQDPVRSFLESHFREQGHIEWATLEGTNFTLAECPECKLVFQRNVPNDAMLGRVYTEMISPSFLRAYEDDLLTVDNFRQIAGEMMMLFRMIDKPAGQIAFLDYGFGFGRWARVARALGATVYATEIGEEKLAMAADIGVRIIPDEAVDGMRFDIVHTEQVLEHLVDPRREFRRLAAITDGVMKVSVPPAGPIRSTIEKKGLAAESPFVRAHAMRGDDLAHMAVQPLEHINAFSVKSIERLASENHMKIVDQVRRRATMMDIGSPKRFLRSLADFGIALGKAALKPHTGYYLLRPER
ncbi:class I SAM-dependent methyltransferase [Sphingobium phenoxybenzoativorans]|uniref:Class I SAM-dependent methyltransferase n=1 Tax=Sphingobium phenoxybenzoativorans TaxID=1592790 RepID=A0A975Q2L9_9SPHN|nr:class I SAM-dependent methyltransferase [Sphingobium phenoxybenzoativorans]QUT06597.1 class I SAM-dependent methyltransferase [Sphingobium phenoxybenzoativorans]